MQNDFSYMDYKESNGNGNGNDNERPQSQLSALNLPRENRIVGCKEPRMERFWHSGSGYGIKTLYPINFMIRCCEPQCLNKNGK